MKTTYIKISLTLIIIVIIAVTGYYYTNMPKSSKEQSCINSGGKVTNQSCCKSATDFPNTCLIGACGCSIENSHNVNVCECPEGKCFDGNECV
jgi:uncharacterized membrane protein